MSGNFRYVTVTIKGDIVEVFDLLGKSWGYVESDICGLFGTTILVKFDFCRRFGTLFRCVEIGRVTLQDPLCCFLG
jgi:hypothetical protein